MHTDGSVELTDVSLTLPGAGSLLHHVSLRLEPGSSTALLGRSGSGKTTLLRMVNGLVRPTSGSVAVNGYGLLSLDEARLRELRRGIGYVIQETGLFPHMTLERNVALPLEIAGTAMAEREKKAHELLAMVGLPPDTYARRYPHQLSGGQRQRAGLARALVLQPSILLLDEPFGALDPLTRVEMQTLLKDLLQLFRATVLLVTHDLVEATRLTEELVFLDHGFVAACVKSKDVWHYADDFVAGYREASQGIHT